MKLLGFRAGRPSAYGPSLADLVAATARLRLDVGSTARIEIGKADDPSDQGLCDAAFVAPWPFAVIFSAAPKAPCSGRPLVEAGNGRAEACVAARRIGSDAINNRPQDLFVGDPRSAAAGLHRR